MPCLETGLTSSNMSFRDHGSIAVIVECRDYSHFEPSSDQYLKCQQLSQNINEIIPTLPNLTAVVLSTYDSYEPYDPETRRNNLYYQNAYDLFYQAQPIPYVKQFYKQDFIRDDPKVLAPGEHDVCTDPMVLNKIWPCYQLAMNNIWQLEYYIKTVVPHVKNIFYFGRSWSVCVQGRLIGTDRLRELKHWGHLPDINVLLHSHGQLDRDDQDNFTWANLDQYQLVEDNIYQYC